MRARVAGDELAERVGDGLEERDREAERRHHAEGVAQPARVLGGGDAALAADLDLDGASIPDELVDPCGGALGGHVGRGVRADRAPGDLVAREIAEREQEIVRLVLVLERRSAVEALERRLEGQHGVRVEQLAQLGLAEQLAQAAVIDGEHLRPSLGERQHRPRR